MSLDINEFAPPFVHPVQVSFFSHSCETVCSGYNFSSLLTDGKCPAVLSAWGLWACSRICILLFLLCGWHKAGVLTCVFALFQSCLHTYISTFFSSCRTCFSIAAIRLNTDSVQHQHAAFKASSTPNNPLNKHIQPHCLSSRLINPHATLTGALSNFPVVHLFCLWYPHPHPTPSLALCNPHFCVTASVMIIAEWDNCLHTAGHMSWQ